jgi:GNAT superfamily N-acetyltransferase
VEYRVLAWPPDTVAFRLDHERFAYAGKFVVPSGAAVAAEGDLSLPPPSEGYASGVVAAASFDPDRTDPATLVVRYVTTRRDRQGEGVGSRLLAFLAARARERGYERARIAVNNPHAYQAAYRAGFAFTGRETGLAELVCVSPGDAAVTAATRAERYRAGLDRFAARDLDSDARAFVERHRERGPPATVDPP